MTLVCFLSSESGGGRKQGRSSCYDDSRSDVACRRIFCGTHPLTRRAGAKPQHDHWPAAVCCPVDRGMLSPTEFDRVRAVECQEERVTIAILEKVHAHHSPKYTPKVRDTTSLVLQNMHAFLLEVFINILLFCASSSQRRFCSLCLQLFKIVAHELKVSIVVKGATEKVA